MVRKVIHPEQYGQYNNNRNGGVDVKQLAMSVAEVLSKRDAEGDDNPSETKKSKGGETKNGFQKMFQKRDQRIKIKTLKMSRYYCIYHVLKEMVDQK